MTLEIALGRSTGSAESPDILVSCQRVSRAHMDQLIFKAVKRRRIPTKFIYEHSLIYCSFSTSFNISLSKSTKNNRMFQQESKWKQKAQEKVMTCHWEGRCLAAQRDRRGKQWRRESGSAAVREQVRFNPPLYRSGDECPQQGHGQNTRGMLNTSTLRSTNHGQQDHTTHSANVL